MAFDLENGQYKAESVENRLKDGVYQVVFAFESLDEAFMQWLASRNLELFPIPAGTEEPATYGIRGKDQ